MDSTALIALFVRIIVAALSFWCEPVALRHMACSSILLCGVAPLLQARTLSTRLHALCLFHGLFVAARVVEAQAYLATSHRVSWAGAMFSCKASQLMMKVRLFMIVLKLYNYSRHTRCMLLPTAQRAI